MAGGIVNLRQETDGRLNLNLVSYHAPGDEPSILQAISTPEPVKSKNDDLPAKFIITDSQIKDPEKKAQVTLTKIGRYLHVETKNMQRLAGRGWFDGIYRGSPVPAPAP